MKPLISVILAVILGFASVTMVVARGHAVGVATMTICSGYGVVTIAIDAEGMPTDAVHPCPECLAGCSVAVLPVQAGVSLPTVQVRRLVVWGAVSDGAWGAVQPVARGPPILI